MPEPNAALFANEGYAVVRPEGIEVISWLREGSPAFARHDFGYDYKAGWTMHMYAFTHSTARDIVVEQLAREDAPAPIRVDYMYYRSTGTLRLAEGTRELP